MQELFGYTWFLQRDYLIMKEGMHPSVIIGSLKGLGWKGRFKFI